MHIAVWQFCAQVLGKVLHQFLGWNILSALVTFLLGALALLGYWLLPGFFSLSRSRCSEGGFGLWLGDKGIVNAKMSTNLLILIVQPSPLAATSVAAPLPPLILPHSWYDFFVDILFSLFLGYDLLGVFLLVGWELHGTPLLGVSVAFFPSCCVWVEQTLL